MKAKKKCRQQKREHLINKTFPYMNILVYIIQLLLLQQEQLQLELQQQQSQQLS
jgi:hypothetical protein